MLFAKWFGSGQEMSSPAVCDSKSPREMVTDHNLQGNGHRSDTQFACIKSPHATHANASSGHTHTVIWTHCLKLLKFSVCFCVAVCVRACAYVFLYVSDTLVLRPGCYKLFSVPGAPLVVSDGFGPPCFPCLPVSIIGSLWCSGSCCLQLTYHRELKEIYNLGEGGENSSAQIKYLKLLHRIYLKPHLNKRLSRLLDRKLHQPLLLWDPEHEVWGKHLGIN